MTIDAPTPQDQRSRPPGWYPDSAGRVRWWDGTTWTVALDQTRPDRTWAVLAHLSMFVLPVIGPIVIRQTAGQHDDFTKHHATEALNAQILFGVIWNLLGGILVILSASDPIEGPPVWLILTIFPVNFLALAVTAGFSIRAAIQASRGSWWRYPISIRVVRGAVKR